MLCAVVLLLNTHVIVAPCFISEYEEALCVFEVGISGSGIYVLENEVTSCKSSSHFCNGSGTGDGVIRSVL